MPSTARALLRDVTRGAQWGRGLLAGCARGRCQRGSELGLERWPGSGACGRRRHRRQRVLSSRGRSRGRRCGWTGRSACELRKSPVAEYLTLGALRADRAVVAPQHRAPPKALTAGLGLPQAPAPLSPVFQTQDRSHKEVIIPKPSRLPAWACSKCPGSASALSCRHLSSQGLANTHCLLCKVSCSRSLFSLYIGHLIPEIQSTLVLCIFFSASGALLEILAAYGAKNLVLDLAGGFVLFYFPFGR